jgi:hypothetical protein
MTRTKDNPYVSFAVQVASVTLAFGIVLSVWYWSGLPSLALISGNCALFGG